MIEWKHTYIEVIFVDKQEYRLKTEQMLKLMNEKSYKEAMEIADAIEWKRVKNTAVLCAVSEIYEANGEYEKGRDILLKAFERASDSKKIIYKLAVLALKLDDMKEATECYEEFLQIAPKDPNRFILKYKILKAKNASLDEQIEVLEEFKKAEYIEKWAFELAKLYQQAGRISECLEECDDLILWFSEGKYIYKAMELKMQYKPLTPLQREQYENRKGAPVVKPVAAKPVVEEPVVEAPVAVEPEVKPEVVEEVAAEPEVVEEAAPAAVEETVEEVVEEPAAEAPAEEVSQATKPLASIEEILQGWQEQQKEDAEMIKAKLEEVEAEKAAQKAVEEPVEENKDSILPDDIRRLMEELEAESADIDAQKAREIEPPMMEDDVEEEVPFGEEENKPLLQKVVEQLTAMDILPSKETVEEPVAVEPEPVEEPAPAEVVEAVAEPEIQMPEEEEPFFEQESFEQAMAEALQEVFDIEEEEEGIKLGDTQSIALSTKALATAAKVTVPQEDVQVELPKASVPESKPVGYDTGFLVQGKYDLEVQSQIGLKAGLTEEQKKLFSYFVPVHGMSEQLVTVLENDKECKSRYGTSRIGNLLVIGRSGSGKTVLAVDIVKAIQKARRMKKGKMAIVSASALNTKDVANIVEKLHGGALIIEEASELNRKTIDDLCEAMEGQTGELLVVLEEERKPLMKLLEAYPNFKKKFTSQVEIPVFINDELVTFGQTYAKENGYKIDEMGILALYSRIDLLQREEKAVTVADVKDVVDEAIDNANSASVKNLMKKLFGKNKDDADRVILTEEDFR